MRKPVRTQTLHARVGLIVICLAMGAVLVTAERATSPTTDEHLHLTRGLAWWWADDTRLSWPHPPLGQLVAAAPVALLAEPIEIADLEGYDTADMKRASLRYFESYDVARAQLSTARRTMIALAVLLAIYLYEWIRRRYGARLALMTTLLYAANPVLLAHAGLMTTDFPVTAVALIALLQLHDYLLGSSWWGLLGLILAVGALLTTKLTGIIVAVILLPPAVFFAATGRGRFSGQSARRRALELGRDVALAAVVGLLIVNAVYRFHDTGLTTSEIIQHQMPPGLKKERMRQEDFVLRFWPDGIPMPLPFTYLYSVQFVKEQNARGHAGYFLGQRRPKGTPGYFPVLLTAKLPSGMIALLVAGLALALRRRFRGLPLDVWVHGYFVLVYLALSFNSHINIGVRHVLLIVPSLAILAGRAANALWKVGPAGRFATIGCTSAVVMGTLVAYPRFIGDFNWLVGGRSGGHWVNVVGEDWGQDVNELAAWQKYEDVPLSYFAQNELRYSELSYLGARAHRFECYFKPPEDHWVAFHLTPRVRENRCLLPYAHREPDLVLNDHILLFAPRSKEAGP
jgi:4-amino-4-deoxy-L-arabinose transferase-like glycosyltransferase